MAMPKKNYFVHASQNWQVIVLGYVKIMRVRPESGVEQDSTFVFEILTEDSPDDKIL